MATPRIATISEGEVKKNVVFTASGSTTVGLTDVEIRWDKDTYPTPGDLIVQIEKLTEVLLEQEY